MITVPVELGSHSYSVLVGEGVRADLAALLGRVVPGAARAAVVTQSNIGIDVDTGLPADVFDLADGEAAKSMSSVEALCRGFARAGLTRADVVVAVGGGVVTDVAGFAASCYHRGVAVVHVPTTLLGQVDAAIGGKTGVNLDEGKNLVGAFWQPSGVICDTAVLAGLPWREHLSGRGEMAKYSFIGAPENLHLLSLDDQVAACVALKAAVVAGDERETGKRAILNYGHTLAHALEAQAFASRPGALRHGEAVAIGLAFAARLAQRLGRIDAARVGFYDEVLSTYELSGTLPVWAQPEELLRLMARDKKAVTGLTFVLDGPQGVDVVSGVPGPEVLAILEEMASQARFPAASRGGT
ncbi:MAG: 3-dehydroquinate synthase family protein [Acidimicrobiales bacterium]